MLARMDQKLLRSNFYLLNHAIKGAGTIINILFTGAEEDNSLPVSQEVNVFKMLFLFTFSINNFKKSFLF